MSQICAASSTRSEAFLQCSRSSLSRFIEFNSRKKKQLLIQRLTSSRSKSFSFRVRNVSSEPKQRVDDPVVVDEGEYLEIWIYL